MTQFQIKGVRWLRIAEGYFRCIEYKTNIILKALTKIYLFFKKKKYKTNEEKCCLGVL